MKELNKDDERRMIIEELYQFIIKAIEKDIEIRVNDPIIIRNEDSLTFYAIDDEISELKMLYDLMKIIKRNRINIQRLQ